MILRAHELGQELFGKNYTIEHRQFSDGDDRVLVKHNYGWSATNYVTISIWMRREDVWVEYYENDNRLTRDVYDLDEWRESAEELSTFTPNW